MRMSLSYRTSQSWTQFPHRDNMKWNGSLWRMVHKELQLSASQKLQCLHVLKIKYIFPLHVYINFQEKWMIYLWLFEVFCFIVGEWALFFTVHKLCSVLPTIITGFSGRQGDGGKKMLRLRLWHCKALISAGQVKWHCLSGSMGESEGGTFMCLWQTAGCSSGQRASMCQQHRATGPTSKSLGQPRVADHNLSWTRSHHVCINPLWLHLLCVLGY